MVFFGQIWQPEVSVNYGNQNFVGCSFAKWLKGRLTVICAKEKNEEKYYFLVNSY